MCANYVFHIQRETVQASRWLSYWCLNVRFCSWTLHAMFWIQTHSPTHHPHVDEIFAKLKISMWICFLAIWKVSIHELSSLGQQHCFLGHQSTCRRQCKSIVRDLQITNYTDQYLHFKSHHHVKQNLGIIKKPSDIWINTIITKDQDKQTEEAHVKAALRNCSHPECSLKEYQTSKKNKTAKQVNTIVRLTIPYINRLSEQVSRAMKKHIIQTVHRSI